MAGNVGDGVAGPDNPTPPLPDFPEHTIGQHQEVYFSYDDLKGGLRINAEAALKISYDKDANMFHLKGNASYLGAFSYQNSEAFDLTEFDEVTFKAGKVWWLLIMMEHLIVTDE